MESLQYQNTKSQPQYAHGCICRCVQYPTVGWSDKNHKLICQKVCMHLELHDQSNMTWMCLHKKHWSD